jgi:hypothetical protein
LDISDVDCSFVVVIITMGVVGEAAIGVVKTAVDIVMTGDTEGVVVDEPQRSLMNPHSLHLLVGYPMVQYREIWIEFLKILM